jgi:hypothetical protein
VCAYKCKCSVYATVCEYVCRDIQREREENERGIERECVCVMCVSMCIETYERRESDEREKRERRERRERESVSACVCHVCECVCACCACVCGCDGAFVPLCVCVPW